MTIDRIKILSNWLLKSGFVAEASVISNILKFSTRSLNSQMIESLIKTDPIKVLSTPSLIEDYSDPDGENIMYRAISSLKEKGLMRTYITNYDKLPIEILNNDYLFQLLLSHWDTQSMFSSDKKKKDGLIPAARKMLDMIMDPGSNLTKKKKKQRLKDIVWTSSHSVSGMGGGGTDSDIAQLMTQDPEYKNIVSEWINNRLKIAKESDYDRKPISALINISPVIMSATELDVVRNLQSTELLDSINMGVFSRLSLLKIFIKNLDELSESDIKNFESLLVAIKKYAMDSWEHDELKEALTIISESCPEYTQFFSEEIFNFLFTYPDDVTDEYMELISKLDLNNLWYNMPNKDRISYEFVSGLRWSKNPKETLWKFYNKFSELMITILSNIATNRPDLYFIADLENLLKEDKKTGKRIIEFEPEDIATNLANVNPYEFFNLNLSKRFPQLESLAANKLVEEMLNLTERGDQRRYLELFFKPTFQLYDKYFKLTQNVINKILYLFDPQAIAGSDFSETEVGEKIIAQIAESLIEKRDFNTFFSLGLNKKFQNLSIIAVKELIKDNNLSELKYWNLIKTHETLVLQWAKNIIENDGADTLTPENKKILNELILTYPFLKSQKE